MKERTTARIVVYNKEHKILLLKIRDGAGTSWLVPGGKIEEHETALDAAKRELFEETGIKNVCFVSQTPQWYCEDTLTLNNEKTLFKEYIFLAFASETLPHPTQLTENEHREMLDYAWWELSEFVKHKETLYPRGLLDKLCKELSSAQFNFNVLNCI